MRRISLIAAAIAAALLLMAQVALPPGFWKTSNSTACGTLNLALNTACNSISIPVVTQ